MKKVTYAILAAATMALVMLLFHEVGILSWLAAILTLSLVVASPILFTVLVILFLVAIPYYILKKKPKTDEYGNYLLEDFKE